MYKLQQITKSYDKRSILSIDHLEIKEGEILAIVGPSGAGKSTLLRLLNFLEPPDSGSIEYRGQPIPRRDVPLDIRRQVTTVFQNPALLSASVQSNIGFGLKLRQRQDSGKNIQTAIQQMGLEHLRTAHARTLSGGEAQRVALARAIVIDPAVLLLDEPTANLDPYNVNIIEKVVRDLNDRRGTTMILVTHNVFQARRLAHRVGLLLGGNLVEISDTQSFFEAPCDERTRAFVNGEMVY